MQQLQGRSLCFLFEDLHISARVTLQVAVSFAMPEDPGVQHYGGDLFADLRDQADEVENDTVSTVSLESER